MGERPCLRALEAHGDMIRSVQLGREGGQRRGFYGCSMAFMGVSTSYSYVKAEKNDCARGGRMCVNRVKSVGRVAVFGGHIGRESRCFTYTLLEEKRFVFQDKNPFLTDQHVSLQATHSHPHENTKKAKNGRKGGY